MICYQTRSDGVFLGTATADPDPEEPGRFALPGGCVELDPPPFDAGQRARWENGAWLIEADPDKHMDGYDVGLLVSWDSAEFVLERVPKPELADNQQAEWNGSEWVITDIPEQPPLPPPAPSRDQIAMHDLENRVRALEGRPAVSLDDYFASLVEAR